MIQIREGVFETNSSSTHSICRCMKSEFEAWKSGLRAYDQWAEELRDAGFLREYLWQNRKYYEELCSRLNALSDEELIRCLTRGDDGDGQWISFKAWCNSCMSRYQEEFTTPSGETVVAFGEYGYDG